MDCSFNFPKSILEYTKKVMTSLHNWKFPYLGEAIVHSPDYISICVYVCVYVCMCVCVLAVQGCRIRGQGVKNRVCPPSPQPHTHFFQNVRKS